MHEVRRAVELTRTHIPYLCLSCGRRFWTSYALRYHASVNQHYIEVEYRTRADYLYPHYEVPRVTSKERAVGLAAMTMPPPPVPPLDPLPQRRRVATAGGAATPSYTFPAILDRESQPPPPPASWPR